MDLNKRRTFFNARSRAGTRRLGFRTDVSTSGDNKVSSEDIMDTRTQRRFRELVVLGVVGLSSPESCVSSVECSRFMALLPPSSDSS